MVKLRLVGAMGFCGVVYVDCCDSDNIDIEVAATTTYPQLGYWLCDGLRLSVMVAALVI